MRGPLPMALTQSVDVELIDERGDVLERASDPPGVWKRAVCAVTPEDFELLALVDPYDDTVFKHRQLDQLEREFSLLSSAAVGEDAAFFERVRHMIKRAGTHARFKIKFVGD